MNKFLLFFLCLFVTNSYSKDFSEVDEIVRKYPSKVSSLLIISDLIKKDFDSDSNKARAIYSWIAFNFKYDATSGNNSFEIIYTSTSKEEKNAKEKKIKDDIISKALTSDSAMCLGYSILFERLCDLVGLKNEIVLGNLKSDLSQLGSTFHAADHSWNAVKINDEWKYVDVTLAAGYISEKDNSFKSDFNEAYFFMSEDNLLLSHFPQNKKWISTNKTIKDFAKLPIYYRDYFAKKYRIYPLDGIILISDSPVLKLEIQNLEEYDRAEYVFATDNKLVYLNNDNNKTTFEIPVQGRSGDYLSIYIDRKIMVSYMIK